MSRMAAHQHANMGSRPRLGPLCLFYSLRMHFALPFPSPHKGQPLYQALGMEFPGHCGWYNHLMQHAVIKLVSLGLVFAAQSAGMWG